MTNPLYVALALVPLLALASPALGGDHGRGRKSLTGLRGVHVLVESFGDKARRAGFDKRTFLTDVEVKLEAAGIPVLTYEEMQAAPAMPWLYVRVTPMHHQPDEMAAAHIHLEVNQWVILASGKATPATTWSASATGIDDLEQTRAEVRNQVDRFINAWLSVNPK